MPVTQNKESVNDSQYTQYSLVPFIPVLLKSVDDHFTFSADGQSITFVGELIQAETSGKVDVLYKIEEREFLVFHASIAAEVIADVKQVNWFHGSWNNYDHSLISKTSLIDNFLIFRKGTTSFFISLDFPYSKINDDGIGYEPNDPVVPGRDYVCHTVSVGACRLSGNMIGDFDRAEIEAFSSYIEKRYPMRFNRPVTSATCITNRMTDVREGRIFYSMYDNPTLFLDVQTIKDEISLCADLGIEFYQLFEGLFDWPDTEITGRNLQEAVALGKQKGVRVGDYVHPGELYCPHYNYEHRKLDRIGWRRQNHDGTRGQFCLAHPDYYAHLAGRLLAHNELYHEELICMDMLDLQPCFDTSHGHARGDLYRQVLGLVNLMQALADLSDQYLVWSNSGNWLEFMPKLLWYNPNVYLTDPHPRAYSPTLNMLKYFGDCRREQMVTAHNQYFVPYRCFTNCEYYFSRHSRVSDLKFFEYSLLQGLAVTPNICFGELRVFLDLVPSGALDSCKQFIRKWLAFFKAHFSVWQFTQQIGDAPGVKANEIYAHIKEDKGFICFVNQDLYAKESVVWLDQRIGLTGGEWFALQERYPSDCRCGESRLPYACFGDRINFIIPAYSVRYIEILPITAQMIQEESGTCRIYGLPAEISKITDGYRIVLTGRQGQTHRLGLALPTDQELEELALEPSGSVPMFTFPAQCEIIDTQGHLAWITLQFPREAACAELTHWTIDGNSECSCLSATASPFIGGYIHNLYSDKQSVSLILKTKTKEQKAADFGIINLPPQDMRKKRDAVEVIDWNRPARRHQYETVFFLPFIEWPSMSMAYGSDEIVELAFTDTNWIKQLTCSINGLEVPVCRYTYPTQAGQCTYYIELMHHVVSGQEVRLALDVTWIEC
ncbi:MAG: hypothetical protein SCM11_10110 [Bacillota bacterium]|nr:hypothetical protein [Bacillota bacterium]